MTDTFPPNQQFLLAARPVGLPQAHDWQLHEQAVPAFTDLPGGTAHAPGDPQDRSAPHPRGTGEGLPRPGCRHATPAPAPARLRTSTGLSRCALHRCA